MDTFIGLDLGQLTDYTASAMLRRSVGIGPRGLPDRDSRGRLKYRFDVAAIKRYPLGTSYMEIVRHVVSVVCRPEMGRYPRLVIDATGVGIPVVEMFRAALKPYEHVELWAITITSGRAVTPAGPFAYHVAKLELVAAIREALESQRLKVPKSLDHADTLKKELQNFQVRITDAGNETFSAREGMHDDLVLAVSLPVWLATLPRLELVVDDDDDLVRPAERVAVSRELRELEEAEQEALALESGEWTPRMRALFKTDPFNEAFGWE